MFGIILVYLQVNSEVTKKTYPVKALLNKVSRRQIHLNASFSIKQKTTKKQFFVRVIKKIFE